MWKNTVERGRPQVTIWRIACWIPKVTEHTLRICNTYSFPTTTVVTRTLYVHCVSCYGWCSCGVTHCGVLHCKLSALFREIIAVCCGNNAEHMPVHNPVDIVQCSILNLTTCSSHCSVHTHTHTHTE